MIFKSSILIVLIILPLFIYFSTVFITRSRILSYGKLPKSEYALVLGAGLKADGLPTDLLRDRVITSIKALKNKKVTKIVFSGSINHKGYSEPMAMKKIARTQGVNLDQIIIDNAGKSTFDSCRTYIFFKHPQPFILVTQPFHLPRSLLICQLLGMNAYGLPASNIDHSIMEQIWWHIREIYAIPYNLLKITSYYIRQLQIKKGKLSL